MLEAMWAANVLDIQSTLAKVCQKVLEDTTVPKPELRLRAQALKEAGERSGGTRGVPRTISARFTMV